MSFPGMSSRIEEALAVLLVHHFTRGRCQELQKLLPSMKAAVKLVKNPMWGSSREPVSKEKKRRFQHVGQKT